MTANFKFDGGSELDTLRALQPNKPLHVTEYWPGWFDHWFSPFHCILTLEGMKYWSIHENINNRFSVTVLGIFRYQGIIVYRIQRNSGLDIL